MKQFQLFGNLFEKKKRQQPTVTLATSCWENDWEQILKDPLHLKDLKIGNHQYPFEKKILIINNVRDPQKVAVFAEQKVKEGILNEYYFSEKSAEKVMRFFQLERADFKAGDDAKDYEDVNDDWIYYNALAPLSAIYHCQTDYLLYMTGDTFLKKKIHWVQDALQRMEKKKKYKVANLTWNEKYDEAKKESFRQEDDFFVSKKGFSDQMFLIKMSDFRRPIYGEIRKDAKHFPRGDVFEKRVFSYMRNRRWQRLTYRHGSYTHE